MRSLVCLRPFALAPLLVALACHPPTPRSEANGAVAAPGSARADGAGNPSATPPAGSSEALAAAPDGRATISTVAEVPAPGEVVLVGRWSEPLRVVESLASQAGLPPELVREGVQKAGAKLASEMFGDRVDADALGGQFDWSASIDVATVVIGDVRHLEPASGISIGLRSLDLALRAFRARPVQFPDGGYGLEPREDESSTPPCGIFPAAGATPARLVCASTSSELRAVGPYLATSLARQAFSGAGTFHLELRARELLDRLGPVLKLGLATVPAEAARLKNGVPEFDGALVDATSAVVDELGALVDDLDTVTLDAGTDGRGGLELSGKLAFADQRSFLVGRIVDVPSRGTVPEIARRAPRDASTAGYGYRGDPAVDDRALEVVRRLVRGKLEELRFAAPADRAALASLLRVAGKKHAPALTAVGHFEAPPKLETLQDLAGAFVGWFLFGFEDDAKGTAAWLEDLVKTYNRPAIQAWLKAQLGSEAPMLPTLKLVTPPRVLGRGALDLELAIDHLDDALVAGLANPDAPPAAAGAPKKGRIALHLLLGRDGGRTFVGVATDRDKLAALMTKSMGKVAGPDTIATVRELEGFLAEGHHAASYSTLKGGLSFVESLQAFAATLPPTAGAPFGRMLEAFRQLPNGGRTPIAFTSDVHPGARPSVNFRYALTKGTLDDLAFLGRKLAEEGKKAVEEGRKVFEEESPPPPPPPPPPPGLPGGTSPP